MYLLGAADGIAAEAAEKLVARYNCRIIGAHNGFLKDPEVNDAVMEELRAESPAGRFSRHGRSSSGILDNRTYAQTAACGLYGRRRQF